MLAIVFTSFLLYFRRARFSCFFFFHFVRMEFIAFSGSLCYGIFIANGSIDFVCRFNCISFTRFSRYGIAWKITFREFNWKSNKTIDRQPLFVRRRERLCDTKMFNQLIKDKSRANLLNQTIPIGRLISFFFLSSFLFASSKRRQPNQNTLPKERTMKLSKKEKKRQKSSHTEIIRFDCAITRCDKNRYLKAVRK